ncbi:MAG: carboxypeptidase regulatory-like domain-containing protein, partial [Bacteroidota bacterium]
LFLQIIRARFKMKFIAVIMCLLVFSPLYGQESLVQTIRGTVTDKQTLAPMPGVSVILTGTEPVTGTITGENGTFRIENVRLGRHNIRFSFMGYETTEISNIQLSSAKEYVVNVEMEEKITITGEVLVKAQRNKDQPINKMALISARSFTVEETQRYAGSFGDPARMASSYAGVMSTGTERNDIIIRGNSPSGLLWRLDDMEIPNPNHFGAMGTTGGPISILNNNLLANSDFFTGAFPAEYGNALAGAFDLKMRNGNNEQHEYWGQFGWNGFELGTEGPFTKNHKSSYIASYRYSMLAAMEELGLGIGYDPLYTDLVFKLHFPGTKTGTFTITGIGGKSKMELWDSKSDSENWTYSNSGEDITFGTQMGAIGISHLVFLNTDTRIKTGISLTGNLSLTREDTFTIAEPSRFLRYGDESSEIKLAANTRFIRKINKRNNSETGIIASRYFISFHDSAWYYGKFQTITNTDGTLTLLRAYTQWQHKFTDAIILYTGFHFQHLAENGSTSYEPRAGLQWNISGTHSLNMGFGMHSQMQPMLIYFYETSSAVSSSHTTNEGLDFTRSNHYIIGYNYLANENLRIKTEAYYQDIYDAPIRDGRFPQYSLLNSGADFSVLQVDSLTNKGTGVNYGIEFTLEKFLSHNYYFLATVSLFESKYTAADHIERNTAFNGNFVINLLGGYELEIGKNNYLTFNSRNVWAGGKRYVPIDIEKSISAGKKVLDWNRAYENKYPDYLRFDIRLGFRINRKKHTQEVAVDLQNITNNKNVFLETFDPVTNEVHSKLQFGFMPMVTWKVQF